jgi:hypothetical protein
MHQHFGASLVHDCYAGSAQSHDHISSNANQPWMSIEEHAGLGAAQDLIDAVVAGRIAPKDGHVVVLT